ncbi:MAG: DUF3795 domain-containing protein [Promethearchaeota archaeon]|jgi:hypothetical protein
MIVKTMENEDYLAYCGVYCKLCGNHQNVPKRAAELKEVLVKEDFEGWGQQFKEFGDFWTLLNTLINVEEDKCCKTDKCGAPFCGIRKCAKEKEIKACPFCSEYPCDKIKLFAKSEGTLLFDGQRLKELGVEEWIKEQEIRRRDGFCYTDVRSGKCQIPR